MNILPLILALALMLSIMTIEKLETFKNHATLEREYQIFLQLHDREIFNQRQKNLFGINQKSLRQLSFRFFLDKEARKRDENVAKQYRTLIIELMKILYKDATFFKNLEMKRSSFLEEMLDAVQKAADKSPENTIKRIQDIARLDLEDRELQEAFYHMLKGTISREELEKLKKSEFTHLHDRGYVSLFNFINYDGKNSAPVIVVQRAPKEILKALFNQDDTVVEAIIKMRNDLAKNKDNGSAELFKQEFKGKIRPGIEDRLVDFSISSSDKTEYN